MDWVRRVRGVVTDDNTLAIPIGADMAWLTLVPREDWLPWAAFQNNRMINAIYIAAIQQDEKRVVADPQYNSIVSCLHRRTFSMELPMVRILSSCKTVPLWKAHATQP
jgi:hypothetical protein